MAGAPLFDVGIDIGNYKTGDLPLGSHEIGGFLFWSLLPHFRSETKDSHAHMSVGSSVLILVWEFTSRNFRMRHVAHLHFSTSATPGVMQSAHVCRNRAQITIVRREVKLL